jgi:hypothetical protein
MPTPTLLRPLHEITHQGDRLEAAERRIRLQTLAARCALAAIADGDLVLATSMLTCGLDG